MPLCVRCVGGSGYGAADLPIVILRYALNTGGVPAGKCHVLHGVFYAGHRPVSVKTPMCEWTSFTVVSPPATVDYLAGHIFSAAGCRIYGLGQPGGRR